MVLVLGKPIEGNIGKIQRTRAHYHFKFLPWGLSKRILFQFILIGKKAPIRFKLKQKVWIFGVPIHIGLSEIKYHNVLETDGGDRILISWDHVHDNTIKDMAQNIKRFDDIVENKRVRINAYWTVKNEGMAENLGLGTGDTEHYPNINEIQILE